MQEGDIGERGGIAGGDDVREEVDRRPVEQGRVSSWLLCTVPRLRFLRQRLGRLGRQRIGGRRWLVGVRLDYLRARHQGEGGRQHEADGRRSELPHSAAWSPPPSRKKLEVSFTICCANAKSDRASVSAWLSPACTTTPCGCGTACAVGLSALGVAGEQFQHHFRAVAGLTRGHVQAKRPPWRPRVPRPRVAAPAPLRVD